MSGRPDVVFLIDVDNTLLDNDGAIEDFRSFLIREVGPEAGEQYWTIFEELRGELGYADYLGAFQRYRLERLHDPRLLLVSSFLLDYPFAERLYPGALEVLAHLRRLGRTVVLTDGDAVFQPRKIERSGIRRAVQDQVLIHIHKEQELDCVERLYPADRYVLIDDKLRILAAVKQIWGDRVTTVFPRQGHYATDPAVLAVYPSADLTIARIGDLLDLDLPMLFGVTSPPMTRSNGGVGRTPTSRQERNSDDGDTRCGAHGLRADGTRPGDSGRRRAPWHDGPAMCGAQHRDGRGTAAALPADAVHGTTSGGVHQRHDSVRRDAATTRR